MLYELIIFAVVVIWIFTVAVYETENEKLHLRIDTYERMLNGQPVSRIPGKTTDPSPRKPGVLTPVTRDESFTEDEPLFAYADFGIIRGEN